jgi:hypothetical protein
MLVLLGPPNLVGGTAALVVSQFLGDFFGVIPLILATSLRQTLLPTRMLGRVGATFRAASGAAMVAGALAGGALGGVFGLRQTLLCAIGGLLIGPIWGALSPLGRVRDMPPGEELA